ncbi:hypothetical protein PIB30_038531 [Stylosanthes scabra]|uniref:Uncharacterized protein n=1 Tax=Stylosanthes scabra TaxID=79078 RepID=A0ABU6VCI5_9FABA|nr:hypothetical protein [Stylosanthes scabra]
MILFNIKVYHGGHFDFTASGSECVLCNAKYAQSDIRHVPFVKNVVGIYRSLDATFSTSLFQQHSSDVRVLEPCQWLQNSVHKSKNTSIIGAGKNQKLKMNGIVVHDKGESIEMYSRGWLRIQCGVPKQKLGLVKTLKLLKWISIKGHNQHHIVHHFVTQGLRE